MTKTQAGGFTPGNPVVSWTTISGTLVSTGTTTLLSGNGTSLHLSYIIPPNAVAGQSASITMNVYNQLGAQVCTSTFTILVASGTMVSGLGWEAQGAGVALGRINNNTVLDMVLMAVDNPPGDNTFRYKIGWDVGANGGTANWSGPIIVGGVGWEAQGGAARLVNLDTNPRPELVLMAVDNPQGGNSFRYRIGWNVDAAGVAASWSNVIQVGGVGWEGQGAGLAFTNLDGDARPEMILMAIDNPPGGNTFRYRVGWNVGTNGLAVTWGNVIHVGGVGWEAQGGGVVVADLDGNGSPEMILMGIDNPAGANAYRYIIGWNLDASGIGGLWSAPAHVAPLGVQTQGGDIAVDDLDNDGLPEFVLVAYDNPAGDNNFWYTVVQWP